MAVPKMTIQQRVLMEAERVALARTPGLVRRNWDHEPDVVTIDYDATASDLKTRLSDLGHVEVTEKDAADAIAYALAGNTEAVLT